MQQRSVDHRMIGPSQRFVRTALASILGIAAASLSLLGATAASAQPAPPSASVYLRIEGATSTIFEGWVTTTPHDVTTAMGGTHECDGLNNGANVTAGPTATTALADAATNLDFTFDGPWSAPFNDFTITRVGPDSQTATQFWGLLNNYHFTPGAGCMSEVKNGDQILWAYDAFNKNRFLKLTGPATATTNVPFTVTVTDGSTGQPVQGATVAGQTTGADGTASLTLLGPGINSFKATAPAALRSNALTVNVQSATSTIVASSDNPSTFGQDVLFRSVVSPTDGNGTVSFFADGSSIAIPGCASAPLEPVGLDGFRASCDAGSGLAVGNHPIHAVYSGDALYLGSSGDVSGGQQVNPAPQTITFPALHNRSIVESPFTITGVTGGGSGNPITFTASGGKCAVTGATVKLLHIGKCTITAHQAAGSGFSAAPPVTRSFKISAAPTLAINDATTVEGNSGSHPLTFTVSLSKAVNVPVSVHWSTANGSAQAPADYAAGSGTLTIAAGHISGTLDVLIKGDRTKEANEAFLVVLDNSHNATIADPNGTGGITNDD